MTKTGYNSLLWTIIFSLVALLLFFIFRFRSSNSITIQARDLLSDTEKEFEAYKAKGFRKGAKSKERTSGRTQQAKIR